MRRLIPSAALVATVLVLAGCAPATPGFPSAGAGTDGSFAGTWVADEPSKGEVPTLTLEANGQLNGTDGCNLLIGHWSATGSVAQFSEIAGTLKYCEGVDDWLRYAATAELDGDTLTILGEDGAAVGELHRTA